jgi:hypothetical protein
MNYQLDQNRAFNYQSYCFPPFRQSEVLNLTVNPSRDQHMRFYYNFFQFCLQMNEGLTLSPHGRFLFLSLLLLFISLSLHNTIISFIIGPISSTLFHSLMASKSNPASSSHNLRIFVERNPVYRHVITYVLFFTLYFIYFFLTFQ